MKLPFSIQQFFQVFRDYNDAIWPLQIFLLVVALFCIVLIGRQNTNRIVSGMIALLWAWMGVVYHFLFFARINPAARLFAVLFLIQSLLILWVGVKKEGLRYTKHRSLQTVLGGLLIVYALFIYPLLSYRFGHLYPYNPTFGVPCPTTIFTIGIFFFLDAPYRNSIFVIPVLWSVIGTTAALLLGVMEDFGRSVAGVMSLLKVFQSTKSKLGLQNF